ncbi:MAG: TolC family protein [bacterium]
MKPFYCLALLGSLISLVLVGVSAVYGDEGSNILRLTAKDSVDLAIKNNPIVLNADLSVGIAEESLKVAAAGSLPKVNLNLSSLPTLSGTAPKAETTKVMGEDVRTTKEFEPTPSFRLPGT